jgi:hypothetical protein
MLWRKALGTVGLVAGLLAGTGWLQGQEPDPGKGLTRLAVLPLHGKTEGHLDKSEDEVYQLAVGAFLRTRRFELMERKRMNDLLTEAKFQNSGLVDERNAARLGRLLGVQWVVIGTYQGELIAFYGDKHTDNVLFRWYTSKLTLTLRMVNVETGKIQETFDASGAHKDSTVEKTRQGLLEDSRLKLDREVANKFPLVGMVLRVDGEKEVMVDLGKKDGVALGDRFQVVEATPDVVHPVTGKVIHGAPKLIGELKVTAVGEESCMMKASGLKAILKPGQMVESLHRKAGVWEKVLDAMK